MSNKNEEKGSERNDKAAITSTDGERINTDGRGQYDWESCYPEEARKEMRGEAIYIAVVLVLSVIGLFLACWGVFSGGCAENNTLCTEKLQAFESVLCYFFAGLLGGTVYGIKYFYRVIARGYWTQDRRYWRIFSPWISSCVALVVGCMVTAGFIKAVEVQTTLTSVCVGFVAGYFADDAVSKMSEVAKALFGTSSKTK